MGLRDSPHIPFVSDSAYPARSGNSVRPLIDGLPAFRRICEAIESAERSFFATIAFVHTDFVMPDDRGSLFDVLDRAAARGLDVRVIFWQSDPAAGIPRRGLVAPIDSLLTELYLSDVRKRGLLLPSRHLHLPRP